MRQVSRFICTFYLVAIAGSAAVAADVQPVPVSLDAQKPHHFRRYTGTDSLLLELTTDNRYRLLDRSHKDVSETDRGDWKPSENAAGSLTFTSDRFIQTLESPPFTLAPVTTDTLENLSSISLVLSTISKTTSGSTIAAREFNSAFDRHRPDINIHPQIDSARLYGKSKNPIISMDELRNLQAAVQHTATSLTPTTATIMVKRYNSITYLEVPETKQLPWASLSHGSGPAALDRSATTSRVLNVFVTITPEEFARESATPLEYLHVPELDHHTTAPHALSTTAPQTNRADPSVDPIAALRLAVPGLQCHLTSTPQEIAGLYSSSGPVLRKHVPALSGELLYLFPDATYLFLDWADIQPRLIRSRGTWRMDNGYISLTDDGTVKNKWGRVAGPALLPLSFPVKEHNAVGILGFPRAYESFFAQENPQAFDLLIRVMERNNPITPEDGPLLNKQLMQKHWRPDYAAGKQGAELPEW